MVLLFLAACSALRPERPGIFYKARFDFVSNEICQQLADAFHSDLGLNPEGNSPYIPGIRCQRFLRAADHSLVVLELQSDTLFVSVLRNKYGSFLTPDASTRTLAEGVTGILKRIYPMAAVEPTKQLEPWPF